MRCGHVKWKYHDTANYSLQGSQKPTPVMPSIAHKELNYPFKEVKQ